MALNGSKWRVSIFKLDLYKLKMYDQFFLDLRFGEVEHAHKWPSGGEGHVA